MGAVGDCNYSCIGTPANWEMPPVPKISYPGEEQALHAVNNLEAMDRAKYGSHGMFGLKIQNDEANLVAVGCRHVCHQSRSPRRVLRRSGERGQGLWLHGELVDPCGAPEGDHRDDQDQ